MFTRRGLSVAGLAVVMGLGAAAASGQDWIDMGVTNGGFSTPGTLPLGSSVSIPAQSGTADNGKLFTDWKALGAALSGTAYSTGTGEGRLNRGSASGKNQTPFLVHDAFKTGDGSYWAIENTVYKVEFDAWYASYNYKTYALLYFGDTNTASYDSWRGGTYFQGGYTPPFAPGPYQLAEWELGLTTSSQRFTLFWDNTGDTTWVPDVTPTGPYAIIHTGTGNQRLGEHMRVGFVGSQYGTAGGATTNLYIDNVNVSYYGTVTPQTWHPGDANKDGVVDLQDFGLLKDNFGATDTGTWDIGDFNGDTAVDLQDFGIMKDHFGHTDGDSPVTAVPEPATSVLLVAGLVAAFRRRSR